MHRNNQDIGSKAQFNFKVWSLGICSILLISIFAAGKITINFSNNESDTFSTKNTKGVHIACFTDNANTAHNPYNLPSVCELVNCEEEGPEEKDSNEENVNEWDICPSTLVSFESTQCNRAKKSIQNSISSIQNRITIPLFVLHHSWRSFLS